MDDTPLPGRRFWPSAQWYFYNVGALSFALHAKKEAQKKI
jgi:hypothetical protein